jgi:hypothetical protein
MYTSSYQDFRFDSPDGHTYTPEGLSSELKSILVVNLLISALDDTWNWIWTFAETVYELFVPPYYFTGLAAWGR